MKVMRRSRWLARLAAMLTVGVVGLIVAASAPAVASNAPPIWAWGNDEHGELGDGSFTQRSSPVRTADVLGGAEITQIVAGGGISAALLANGTGDGTTTQHRTPVQVPGLNGIVQVSANDPSFAVRFTGTVFAWGSNGSNTGVLGLGATADVAIPTWAPARRSVPTARC